jgi:hypothetical protein
MPAEDRTGGAGLAAGWEPMRCQDFEGMFPYDWTLYGDPTWGEELLRSHGGNTSGYCVGSSIDPPGPYPPNANSWMVYGPFSLVGATDARLDFDRWLDTEVDCDSLYWLASSDGQNFSGYGTSGREQTWVSQYFDLKDVPGLGNLCGEPQVWIAFYFKSDACVEYEGVYIDDVLLQKYINMGDYDHVTITDPDFAPRFADLSDFVEDHLGLNDTVVSLLDIYLAFPGPREDTELHQVRLLQLVHDARALGWR